MLLSATYTGHVLKCINISSFLCVGFTLGVIDVKDGSTVVALVSRRPKLIISTVIYVLNVRTLRTTRTRGRSRRRTTSH